MIQFFLHQFSMEVIRLETERVFFNKAGLHPGAAETISHEIIRRIVQLLSGLKRQCEVLELSKARDKVSRLQARVDRDICSYQIMMVELQELSNIIACELDERILAFIPAKKSTFFEQDELFGEAVSTAFPSAKIEIKSAGNCLATDLNTAAIFHLMRAVEVGLRALARHLKVRIRRLPLEYAEWGRIIPQIEAKIALKRPKARGKKQSEALEFYHGVIGEFRAFKDVWRNSVMHSHETYDENEAIRVFNHVRGFLRRLAERVSE